MEAYQRRIRQINEALFDYFVNKNILEENADKISKNGTIDSRYMNKLAKELACNSLSLKLAIKNSVSRILGSDEKTLLSVKEEEMVMLAVSKINIKRNKESLINARRMFGNLAAKLNKRSPSLRIKTSELIEFARPIYHEVIDEL